MMIRKEGFHARFGIQRVTHPSRTHPLSARLLLEEKTEMTRLERSSRKKHLRRLTDECADYLDLAAVGQAGDGFGHGNVGPPEATDSRTVSRPSANRGGQGYSLFQRLGFQFLTGFRAGLTKDPRPVAQFIQPQRPCVRRQQPTRGKAGDFGASSQMASGTRSALEQAKDAGRSVRMVPAMVDYFEQQFGAGK